MIFIKNISHISQHFTHMHTHTQMCMSVCVCVKCHDHMTFYTLHVCYYHLTLIYSDSKLFYWHDCKKYNIAKEYKCSWNKLEYSAEI